MKFDQDDTANVADAGLGALLAQKFGPIGAVERLRMLSDTFEIQLLDRKQK